MAKKATMEEYLSIWEHTGEYVEKLKADGHLIEGPWVDGSLRLNLFKTMVKQKGWTLPAGS